MARLRHAFTIYDAMEAKGVFDANPANPSSRDGVTGEALYKGPVPYPRMLYHPKGDEIVIVPAEIVVTPLGPQRVGEQRVLVHKLVNNAEEEKALRAEGWHDHPAKAIGARLGVEFAPAISPDEKIKQLEEQLRNLQAEKADVEAKVLAEQRSSGRTVGVKQQSRPSATPVAE
jgi:hypothetical protein